MDKSYQEIIERLLINRYLDGFDFGMYFGLLFTGDNVDGYIRLDITSDWYFGEKDIWDRRIKELLERENMAQPDEPLCAFELAKLRWSDGYLIKSVELCEGFLRIIFESGKFITISNITELDSSWTLSGYKNTNSKTMDWNIVCEDNTIYSNNLDNINYYYKKY